MNHLSRRARTAARKLQKGFTLIELAIVGLFLGLLAIFAITQFTGSVTNETRANAIIEASQKITDNWSLVAQTCGLSSAMNAATTGADLTLGNATASGTEVATGDNNLGWLVGAGGTVHATYTACVASSGVKQMNGLTSGAVGSLKMNGYDLSVAASSTSSALALSFGNVPTAVSTILTGKLGSMVSVTGTTVTITRPL